MRAVGACNMRRRDFISLVGWTKVYPFAAIAQKPHAIDETLRTAVERKEIPGVVAMAADRSHVHFIRRSGWPTSPRPDQCSWTRCSMASMTKPVTAVAAMQLIERDRLALDDPAAGRPGDK